MPCGVCGKTHEPRPCPLPAEPKPAPVVAAERGVSLRDSLSWCVGAMDQKKVLDTFGRAPLLGLGQDGTVTPTTNIIVADNNGAAYVRLDVVRMLAAEDRRAHEAACEAARRDHGHVECWKGGRDALDADEQAAGKGVG